MSADVRRQLVPVVLLGLALLAGVWWYFWWSPTQRANAQVAEQIRSDGDRIAALQAELVRLRAADVAVPVLAAAEVVDRWNDVVRALEAGGLTVTRVEPAPPAPVASPLPASETATPAPPPPTPGAPPSPPALAEGEQGRAAQPPAGSPLAQIQIGLTFTGDYTRLRAALAAAAAALKGTAWIRLELDGQSGDGVVTAKGEVQVLALVSQAGK